MSQSYKEFATVYDQLMMDMPYDQWLQFAQDVWNSFQLKPTTVVDLGCGTGTIAISLAKQGMNVTGIDLSSTMLEIAEDKWKSEHNHVGQLQLIEADMSQWSLHEQVDSVISFCDCLNYIVDEDNLLATFYATYNGLKAGGIFTFDVHDISRFEEYAEEQPFVYDEDGISYIWTSDYDDEEHIIDHQLAIFVEQSDGRYRRIDEEHTQRAYEPQWLYGALQSVGFSEVHIYREFELSPYDEHTKRLFFVAIK